LQLTIQSITATRRQGWQPVTAPRQMQATNSKQHDMKCDVTGLLCPQGRCLDLIATIEATQQTSKQLVIPNATMHTPWLLQSGLTCLTEVTHQSGQKPDHHVQLPGTTRSFGCQVQHHMCLLSTVVHLHKQTQELESTSFKVRVRQMVALTSRSVRTVGPQVPWTLRRTVRLLSELSATGACLARRPV